MNKKVCPKCGKWMIDWGGWDEKGSHNISPRLSLMFT